MIEIYTDGSSRGNPGPGGFGAIIISEHLVKEIGGAEKHTTNNRMELKAAIHALESLPNEMGPIVIYTDSEYLMKGITQWIHNWIQKNWRTAAKKAVENQDLWQALLKNVEGREISWKYVAGHAGHEFNERADEIATSFADEKEFNLYDGPRELYRKS